MKKAIVLLLTVAVLTLSLAACGGSASSVAAPASSVPVSQSTAVAPASSAAASAAAPVAGDPAMQAIADTLKDTAAVENPVAIDNDELYYTMNVTLENIDTYAGYYTGVTGSSGTVLAVQAKDGCADAVKSELQTYCTTNADFLSNYPEFAQAQTQAENGRVEAKGNTVVLVIAAADIDYATVDSAIAAALQ